MRPVFYVAGVGAVIGFAVWAYQQNYATQDALKELDLLNGQIAVEREKLAMLRAEWAYLNRPDRLSELVAMNFDRLRLLPMSYDSFGKVEQVAFPELAAADLPARPGAEEAR